MYHVYVLKSLRTGRYYIGCTGDLGRRLEMHNKGRNKSTKHGRPWEVLYQKEYGTEREARRREKYLKSLKKRRSVEKLLGILAAG